MESDLILLQQLVFEASYRHYIYTIVSPICKFATGQNHQERWSRTFGSIYICSQFLQILSPLFYLATTELHFYRSPSSIVEGDDYVRLKIIIIMVMTDCTSQILSINS